MLWLCRTTFTSAVGIKSSYPLDNDIEHKVDVGELGTFSRITIDSFKALKILNNNIAARNGTLLITDMWRGYLQQERMYQEWKQGLRKDYAAPGGRSWHGAGRAIDIDLDSLSMSLSDFWVIAEAAGWDPIVSKPVKQSESWHFQYLGEWKPWRGLVSDGELAAAANLDCGIWDSKDDKWRNRFLQAQLNRVRRPQDSMWLVLDGIVGPSTRQALENVCGPSCTPESAIEKLIGMKTPDDEKEK